MANAIRKELSNEIRCLRMHLKPILSKDAYNLLKEAEIGLAGVTSATPGPLHQNNRKATKKDFFDKLYNKGL